MIQDPQRDLPAGLRGGSDTWDKQQASALLAHDFFPEGGSPPDESTGFGANTTAAFTQAGA